MSLRKAPQRRAARQLYLKTALSQREIANAVGVNEKTLYCWIKNGHWADEKRLTYHSPEQELQHLYEQLRRINEIVSCRKDTNGLATKEELDLKTKIMALIAGHLKQTGSNWRNVAPDFDQGSAADAGAPEAGTKKEKEPHVETVEELKKRIGEEDFNNKYGKRFSPEKLDEYYNKVARMLVLADSTKKKYDADGNYIANDGRGPKIPPRKWGKQQE